MLKKTFSMLALALFALLSIGCCPNQKMNVTVSLDEAMKKALIERSGRSLQVDIVAVNSAEHQRWQEYSMTKYWAPPYDLRNSVTVYTMVFDPNNTTKTLPANDPIWNKWFANASDKDLMRLYVLANMPGANFEDARGNQDARRQIIPLGKCRWDGDSVKFEVQPAGVRTLSNFKIRPTD